MSGDRGYLAVTLCIIVFLLITLEGYEREREILADRAVAQPCSCQCSAEVVE